MARQEKEVKEARVMVLRNALESHYSDLCSYAERLSIMETDYSSAVSSRDEYLRDALRHHLPRSPIWGYLRQRENLRRQIDQLKQEAGRKIKEAVEADPRLRSGLDSSETGVVPGIVGVLQFQIEQWARGGQGLDIDSNLIQEKAEEGFANLRYGAYQLGRVMKEHVELIREAVRGWELRIRQWEEYTKLEKSFTELRRVEKDLREELAVITLRRVVPGRCRYCPL